MIDISSLRVFLAAAEEKNFSQAAKRLHMSQSAVSQHIQGMERSYHMKLFMRRGRSVALSEAGEALLPMAREIVRATRLLEDRLQEINHQVVGELLIGCSTSAGKYLMPALLSIFQEKYSDVHPRVKIMGREIIYECLLNQELPIGVTSKAFKHREIECLPLFEDNIYLIVPANHTLANFERITPGDLIGEKLIVREESSGTCESVMRGLKGFGITPDMLNITMELGSPEAIEMAVERGMGIAFVSEMVAARGLALGRIKKIGLEGLDLKRTVFIARHLGFPFTRAQSLFWDFAQTQHKRLNTDIWQSLTSYNSTI